jgi:hypothetical protein
MDVHFLREISEAYVIDSGVAIEPDQIFENLYGVVKHLQLYDTDLYNEMYKSSKVTQQQILKEYLDVDYKAETEIENLDESLTFGLSGILVILSTLIFGKSAIRRELQGISWLSSYFEKFGKALARQSKYLQIRYAIIYKNTSKCYTKCHVTSNDDIKFLTHFSIKSNSRFSSGASAEQGRCLRECYIDSLIDLIALHMESYFACLKLTGGDAAVKGSDADDIMRMIASTNVSSMCEDYYKAARESLDNFYKVLEFVYEKGVEDHIKMNRINDMRSKIYSAKQTLQKSDNQTINKNYKPPFQQKSIDNKPSFQQRPNR